MKLTQILLGVVFGLGLTSNAGAQKTVSVPFISGGVGEDSAAQFDRASGDYTMKLLFATKDGHYIADVAVQITNLAGDTVLETTSEGPFLLAKIAPGKYQVRAVYLGLAQTRSTTMPAKGRRELVFRWQEETERDALTE